VAICYCFLHLLGYRSFVHMMCQNGHDAVLRVWKMQESCLWLSLGVPGELTDTNSTGDGVWLRAGCLLIAKKLHHFFPPKSTKWLTPQRNSEAILAVRLLVIIGISNKDTWHNTHVFDLTYFWRSQRSKFNGTVIGMFRYRISARSDFKYGRQAAILESQQSAIYYSWTNGWIISKFLS
jgi:hypothetical protein